MTPERADEIELELRRAAMTGPIDDRQRLIGLALEAIAGYRRAESLRAGAQHRAEFFRGEALRLYAIPAALRRVLDSGAPVAPQIETLYNDLIARPR